MEEETSEVGTMDFFPEAYGVSGLSAAENRAVAIKTCVALGALRLAIFGVFWVLCYLVAVIVNMVFFGYAWILLGWIPTFGVLALSFVVDLPLRHIERRVAAVFQPPEPSFHNPNEV